MLLTNLLIFSLREIGLLQAFSTSFWVKIEQKWHLTRIHSVKYSVL